MGIKVNTNGGGSGAGLIKVKDESTLIGEFDTITFVGNQVTAIAGTGEAVIQIPPSSYASYFNQAGALVADITTTSRIVASPISEGTPYKIGSWTGGTPHPCSNSGSLVYQTSGLFSIFNNTSTTIKVDVLDADGVTVIATHTETLTGNIDITTDNIRIEITGFTTDTDKYKASFRSTINLAAILPQGGRYSVRITHTNTGDGGPYVKLQSDIFYDSNPINPTITNPTLSENTPNIVNLSGINFYGLGSTFNAGIADVDNINNRSYPSTFLNIIGSDFGLPQLNLTGANLTGWTSAYDNTNASYTNAGWTITQTNFFNKGSLKSQARWIDWVNGTLQDSITISALVSTYVNNATRIYEDFRNESRRLKSDYTTSWDSTQSLVSYEGGNGLQVIQSKLIYPQEDFTIYSPSIGTQKDYTSLTGDRIWNSHFYHTSVNHSNGIFKLTGYNITEAMLLAKDVDIQISLDKISWYTLTQDYLGGALSNGAGCRVETDVYNLTLNGQLKFTLGTGKFTDATSDWGIWYKIIYKDNVNGKTSYIDSFEIIDWV